MPASTWLPFVALAPVFVAAGVFTLGPLGGVLFGVFVPALVLGLFVGTSGTERMVVRSQGIEIDGREVVQWRDVLELRLVGGASGFSLGRPGPWVLELRTHSHSAVATRVHRGIAMTGPYSARRFLAELEAQSASHA